MPSTQIAYDTQSGRIVSIHNGDIEAHHARARVEHYNRLKPYIKTDTEQLGMISVPEGAFKPGKRYKVDVKRKVLVEAAPNEGVGFGFGSAGRSK